MKKKDLWWWVIMIACLLSIGIGHINAQTMRSVGVYHFIITPNDLIEGVMRPNDTLTITINDMEAVSLVEIVHADERDEAVQQLIMHPITAEQLPKIYASNLVDRGDGFVPIEILSTHDFKTIVFAHRYTSGWVKWEVAQQRRYKGQTYYAVFSLEGSRSVSLSSTRLTLREP